MAIPVIFAAIYLARYNMANLPAQVGIDLQTTGVYAQMISRDLAVLGPLAVTGGCLLLIAIACSLFVIYNDIALQMVGSGYIMGVVQDSVETALNSAGDVEFAATAEYHQWRKEGKPLPDFLQKK